MARGFRLSRTRRLFNAIVKPLLRTPLAPPHTYVLTVAGRRTGKHYSTPVFLIEDGERWLVAPYGEVGWVRNARAAGEATLSRRGRSERVALEEAAPRQAAPVLKRYLDAVPVVRPFFDVRRDSSLAEIAAEAPRHPVFLVREYRHEKEGSEGS